MEKKSRIYVAGHSGLVGSAITNELKSSGYNNLILRERDELDLMNYDEVSSFFEHEKPGYIFLAAAKVGGILANNTFRGEFIYENLQIQNNVIHLAWKYGVKKLLFLGSSCIYPRNCPQPMKEEYLLTAPLEYTNEPYAIAKIAGMKMCEAYNLQYGTDFIAVMPTNLYGLNDNYNLQNSHVLPALIRKMYLAKNLEEGNFEAIRNDLKEKPMSGIDPLSGDSRIIDILQGFGINKDSDGCTVKLWGTGKPRREFLHSADLAKAVVFIMNNISFKDVIKQRGLDEIRNTHINIGSGEDLSINQLAETVKKITGFNGKIEWDSDKPDGTFRKLMDNSRLKALGWKPEISLVDGISRVFKNYCNR